jgi:hypothetical protein
MFPSKSPRQKTGLEIAIDELLSEMKGYTADTEEYAKMVDQLDTLYKLKDIDKPERIKPDTLAIIGGNVLVAVVIVGFERTNIMTSKALSFLLKTR